MCVCTCVCCVQLAAEVGACAVSHCERVSEAGMVAMAQASVTAVLLPTTAYLLRLQPPPARTMIEKGKHKTWRQPGSFLTTSCYESVYWGVYA